MYAPFEGRELLRAYVQHRRALRDRLVADAQGAPPIPGPARGAPFPLPGAGAVVTDELVLELWRGAFAEPAAADAGRDAWTDALRTKFEIAGRLAERYSDVLRPGAGPAGLEAHAILAALITLRYTRGRDVRDLNAALKLVDFLASQEQAISSQPLARLALRVAVDAELEAVERLMTEHGVRA